MTGSSVLDDLGFDEHGILVLRGVVSDDLCGAARRSVEPSFERDGDERRTNAWWHHESVRQVALEPQVLAVLADLYGRRPIPFQTLNFRVGTEQLPHRDSLHFDSLPSGLMCGVWVALEDVGIEQGPVLLWPGSHRRSVTVGDPVPFTARAGDVLVWAADLEHGGAPVLDPLSTRWSQVTHYFFEGCTYLTPMHSDVERGTAQLRRPLIDLSTWRPVRHEVDGRPARFIHGPGRQSRVLSPADRVSPLDRARSVTYGLLPYVSGVLRPWVARLLRSPGSRRPR